MIAFGKKNAILASKTPTLYSPERSSVRNMRASRTSIFVRVKSTINAWAMWPNSIPIPSVSLRLNVFGEIS